MPKFSVSKDMIFFILIKEEGGGNTEGGGAFMSNTDYQRIEN
jgi:hypothetical protein